MEIMFLTLVLFMKGVQGYFSKKLSGFLDERATYLTYLTFNMFLSSIFALIVMLIIDGKLAVNYMTFWLSMMCGVSIAICMLANLMALKEGAVVLVQIFAMAGILVPCIAGNFLFNEKVTVIQFLGIGVLIVSTILLMQYNKSIYGKLTPKMILLILITLISNGTTMLAQKMFAFYLPDGNVSMFSFLSFGIPTIFLALMIKPIAKNDKSEIKMLPKNVIMIGIILAVALLSVSQISTIVSKVLPSILVFPIVNGGGLILTTIIASVFFKEKLTIKSMIGLLLGLGSLVVINGL